MKNLSGARSAVGSASPEDWPFLVSDLARGLEAELGRPSVLIDIADRLAAIAQDHGCQAVTGASRIGGQLAGAVVARAKNGIRLFSAGEAVDTVLVVDGVLATGTQIARAARVAKDSGARRAVAAVVLGNREAIDTCRQEIQGDVVVLDEF